MSSHRGSHHLACTRGLKGAQVCSQVPPLPCVQVSVTPRATSPTPSLCPALGEPPKGSRNGPGLSLPCQAQCPHVPIPAPARLSILISPSPSLSQPGSVSLSPHPHPCPSWAWCPHPCIPIPASPSLPRQAHHPHPSIPTPALPDSASPSPRPHPHPHVPIPTSPPGSLHHPGCLQRTLGQRSVLARLEASLCRPVPELSPGCAATPKAACRGGRPTGGLAARRLTCTPAAPAPPPVYIRAVLRIFSIWGRAASPAPLPPANVNVYG